MSRSESPSKSALSDEDLIKKLKSLLIKEKRINKENIKIICDLKEENVTKAVENKLLIDQIQRLSENIGNFNEKENDKVEEINNLLIVIDNLRSENESLKLNDQKRISAENETQNEVNNFLKNFGDDLKLLFNESDDLFKKKNALLDNNTLFNFGNNIINVTSVIRNSLKLSRDELLKCSLKCADLEGVILTKDKQIESFLKNENAQLKNNNDKDCLCQIQAEVHTFITEVKAFLKLLIIENNDLFCTTFTLEENDTLSDVSKSIIKVISYFKENLKANQNNLENIEIKYKNLESIILSKDLEIETLINSDKCNIKELRKLSILINDLRNENATLQKDYEKESSKQTQIQEEKHNFILMMGNYLKSIVDENDNIFEATVILDDNDNLSNVGINIMTFVTEMKNNFKIITKKCKDLKEIISSHDEKIKSLINTSNSNDKELTESESVQVSNLVALIDDLKKENESLRINNSKESSYEISNLGTKIRNDLKILMKENKDLFKNELVFSNNDSLCDICNNILRLLYELKSSLKSYKEANDIIQDGLSTMTIKCNDLETKIEEKDEKIKLLQNTNKKIMDNENETNSFYNNSEKEMRLNEDDNVQELNTFINLINDLKKEDESLRSDKVNESSDQIQNEVNNFITTVRKDLTLFIEKNKSLFRNELVFSDNNSLSDISKNILGLLFDFKDSLKSNKEMNDIIQDGLDKMTMKCTDLEIKIEDKNKKIKVLQTINTELKEKIISYQNQEIKDLLTSITNLKKEKENLEINIESQSVEHIKIKNEIDNFVAQIGKSIHRLIEENNDLFTDKSVFVESNSFLKVSNNIAFIICNVTDILKSNKDLINVLQEQLLKVTLKSMDLETIILKKDEEIGSFAHYAIELDQKDEQIKRLEELIEDNRNISRALESERDQLQNDLVDLRQRHEEKEGYLIEEFREAQLSLENYRIFTDKQSAEKANEIERLRKSIDDYKESVSEGPLISDYSMYKDIDTLFDKLKTEFNIDDAILNYEDIILSIIERYKNVNLESSHRGEIFRRNEDDCRKQEETIVERVHNYDESLVHKNTSTLDLDITSEDEILNDLHSKLLEKEDKLHSLQTEMEHIKSGTKAIEELLDLSDSSLIFDKIKKILSMNSQYYDELELYKCQNDEQRICYEKIVEEKDGYISDLTERLTEAGKHLNHSDLMNLEMAEIDKTLINLNNQILFLSSKITNLESTIHFKEDAIETLTNQLQNEQKQIKLLEERNNKMKQMLVKTKRELTEYKAQVSTLQEKDSGHTNEIERFNLLLEDTKVSLSEAINEKEKLQERYNSFSKKMDSVLKKKEVTICSLRSQLDSTVQNYKCLQEEYDFYKVKVQTAFNTKLRSPATFSDFMTLPTNDRSDYDETNSKSVKNQITDLEIIIDDLKIDLRDRDEKIFSLNSDLELVRFDNEKLSERLKCMMKEVNDLTLRMQQINEQLQNDTKLHQLSHSDMLQRFNIEKDKLNAMFQIQIESLRSNYEMEMQSLSQKLEEKEMEKVKFQEEIWDCREQLKTADIKLGQIKYFENEHSSSVINEIWNKQLRSPLGQERQQGEGMEMNNETENSAFLSHKILSPKQFPKSTAFVSLDQLLNSNNDEQHNMNEELIDTLRAESTAYRRKIEHLTDLLNDSEATVARLTEQALLLKTEIRRLENNQERDNTLEDNASKEYLKNVIIKFLHYDTKSDERAQLIPVIVTLLSLDVSEKELLTKFARISTYNRKDGDGWSSYFTWTGMS